MDEITRASASDAGCWIDGHWGQYGPARMITMAAENGYKGDVVAVAERHMDECNHPGKDNRITGDDYEALGSAMDEVESWLNANVAPEGFLFGWFDGEFFLSADTDEDEES